MLSRLEPPVGGSGRVNSGEAERLGGQSGRVSGRLD